MWHGLHLEPYLPYHILTLKCEKSVWPRDDLTKLLWQSGKQSRHWSNCSFLTSLNRVCLLRLVSPTVYSKYGKFSLESSLSHWEGMLYEILLWQRFKGNGYLSGEVTLAKIVNPSKKGSTDWNVLQPIPWKCFVRIKNPNHSCACCKRTESWRKFVKKYFFNLSKDVAR